MRIDQAKSSVYTMVSESNTLTQNLIFASENAQSSATTDCKFTNQFVVSNDFSVELKNRANHLLDLKNEKKNNSLYQTIGFETYLNEGNGLVQVKQNQLQKTLQLSQKISDSLSYLSQACQQNFDSEVIYTTELRRIYTELDSLFFLNKTNALKDLENLISQLELFKTNFNKPEPTKVINNIQSLIINIRNLKFNYTEITSTNFYHSLQELEKKQNDFLAENSDIKEKIVMITQA